MGALQLPDMICYDMIWNDAWINTLNELVVESQYLLELQRGRITKVPRVVTAKFPRHMSRVSSSASEVTTLWRYTNLFIIIIIISH